MRTDLHFLRISPQFYPQFSSTNLHLQKKLRYLTRSLRNSTAPYQRTERMTTAPKGIDEMTRTDRKYPAKEFMWWQVPISRKFK